MANMKPKEVTGLDLAVGGKLKTLMPDMQEIPDEFKNMNSRTKWNKIISEWFFSGLPKETKFIPKDGIDEGLALRHISAILRSFEPKHEHKTAACAYLLSIWFDDVIIPETKAA